MWYNKKQIKIIDPKDWYDKIYKQYKQHHNFLENFDKNLWQRFVPKNMKNKIVADLWSWDWRISHFFQSRWVNKYIWIDISSNMLWQNKKYVQTIKHDLNNPFPLENESCDLVISLFTLLHLNNIDNFFYEVYKILKEKWIFILFHHIERKNYIYEHKKEKFKINSHKWSYKQIEDLLEYNFFKFNIYDVMEKNTLIWKYFVCTK